MDDRPSRATRPSDRREQARAAAGSRAAAMRRRQWLLGLGATLIVLALQGVGVLDRQIVEYASLDVRAQWFGRSSLTPSPEIAIVAIDDRAIETVGRWPWDRARLAQAIDELSRAGASVIAMDLLLDSPQAPRYAPGREGPIDDDGLIAAAMARHGRVVIAANFALDRARGTLASGSGLGEEGAGGGATRISMPALAALLEQRPELREMPEADALALLAKEMLSESEASASRSAALDDLSIKFGAARGLAARLPASSMPLPDRAHFWPRSSDPRPPIGRIASAAAAIANVTISGTHDNDGKVRRVPLLVEHQGRLWPMLGLSAVALHRGVPLSDLRLEEDRLLAPHLAGGEAREVPLRRERIRGRTTDGLFFLTWPRAMEGWVDQFRPLAAAGAGEGAAEAGCATTLSIGGVLHPVLVAERIAANAAELDRWTRRAIAAELLVLDGYESAAEGLGELDVGGEAWRARLAELRPFWEQAAGEAAGFLEFLGEMDGEEPESEEDRARLTLLKEIAAKFPRILEEIDYGLGAIERQRRVIRSLVSGRICLVGFASTAAPVDVVGTSIHSYTPGVYVHAAVANSLLTGMSRSRVPLWLDLLSVAVLGLLGTFVGARGTVITGPLAVALLIVLWFLVTAVAFWDAWWSIIAFTGPGLAAAGGWLAVMLHRLLVEQRARRRTEERFRSYVSPAVVDILVNNPELDSMAPQERELTVMFTDLAGFTTIAERLGSVRTAEVLATYLGAMTEVLQSTGATLDKYLGDGMMAFWGAPIADEEHAVNACRAVLEMMRTLDRLNAAGAFGEGEMLHMRVGLAAGELMVGDFGNPPRNSSYTVIGDAANLAARLESANKQLGTRVLVSQRVYELVGEEGGFRWRPIGRIAVKGKAEAEGVYELVGDDDQSPHGGRTGEWIELTRRAVEAFARGEFDAALAGFDLLEREFGEGRLAEIYRRSVAEWRNLLASAADGGAEVRFDGTITLTEK